jgi:hypothetical protein
MDPGQVMEEVTEVRPLPLHLGIYRPTHLAPLGVALTAKQSKADFSRPFAHSIQI